MRLSKNKLRQLQDYFSSQPAIQKVHLFGSFARGEATAKSDVDLLVVLNYDLDMTTLWRVASVFAPQLILDIAPIISVLENDDTDTTD